MEQMSLNLFDACNHDFTLPDNVLDLSTSNAEVQRIRKLNIIDGFLNRYHYLHTSDVFKSIGPITRAYGLYLGGELAGVIV